MFPRQNIRKSVMKAVEDLIVRVQADYDAECDRISREAEAQKMVAHEKAVNSIIGKFQ